MITIEPLTRALELSRELLSILPLSENEQRLVNDLGVALEWYELDLVHLEMAYHDARDVSLAVSRENHSSVILGIVTAIHAALFAATYLLSGDPFDLAEAFSLAKDAHKWNAELMVSCLSQNQAWV